MSPSEFPPPAILPQVEAELLRVARRRAARGRPRRRWLLAVAAASLLAAAAALAATGGILGGGTVSGERFTIEIRPAPAGSPDELCLRLRAGDRPPAYGCGATPSSSHPFGPLIADSVGRGGERVVYGLVSDSIALVRVLTGAGDGVGSAATPRPGVPGRFFSAVVPEIDRIAVVGYDRDGSVVARVGSLVKPARPPRSKAEAIRQGDPAGFAPTAPTPETFIYEGRRISEAEATRRGLACLQAARAFRCFDDESELPR